MSSNNYWLWSQLNKIDSLEVQNSYKPLIVVKHNLKEYRIYTPTPDEYIISVEIVQKVSEMGCNIISFPTTWCRCSYEASRYGQENGVEVMPHGALFDKFKQ